jgi:N-acetylglucosamine malate deacetylase 1
MSDRTEMVHKYAGRTVLALGAHPDDLELGVGGTLALLARAGANVIMAIVSVPNNLAERKEEAKRSADLLGASRVQFLFPDQCSRVEDLKTYELVDRVDDLVREHQPAVLLSHGLANFHKDHVLVYNACVAAQRLNFFDLFCYHPTSTRPIPLPFFPQAYVDISETVNVKMDAIKAHASQFGARGLDTVHFLDVARHYGRLAGVEFAEGLEVVRMKLN